MVCGYQNRRYILFLFVFMFANGIQSIYERTHIICINTQNSFLDRINYFISFFSPSDDVCYKKSYLRKKSFGFFARKNCKNSCGMMEEKYYKHTIRYDKYL